MAKRPKPPSQIRPPKGRWNWRQSKWLRRIYVALIALLALGVVSRLVVMIALPPVIRSVAQRYGMKADYERMELYLLNGDVGIWHFSLAPAEGGNQLVQSDYTRIHISTFDLMFGKLTVRRLESEGVDLEVDRNADGTIPWLQRFSQWTSHKVIAPSTTQPSQTPEQIDLSSPLEIDAFRLTNIHAHIVDAAVSPAMDAMVEVNLRLTDLDSTVRPTHFEMDLTGSPILDLLHVEGMGTSVGKSLSADFRVEMKGFHPLPATGYLHMAGIRPTSGNVTVELNAHIKTTGSAQADALAANLLLDHLIVIADGEQSASLDKVSVNADAINYELSHVTQVAIEGGQLLLHRNSRGEMGVGGLEVIEPQVLVRQLKIPITAALRLIPERWSVGNVAVKDLKLNFSDQSIVPAANLALNLNELAVSGFSPEHRNDVTTVKARLSAPGVAGSIRIDGQIRPFAATKDADVTVGVDGIQADALRPYLDNWGLQSDFAGGTFTSALHVDVTPEARGALLTNAQLSKLALNNNGDLLALDNVGLSGAAYDPASGRLHVKSIDISGPKLVTGREIGGGFAALGLHTKPRVAAVPAPQLGVDEALQAFEPEHVTHYVFSLPKLQIDHFSWKSIGINFNDLATTPNTLLGISDAGVELNDVNVDFDPKDAAAPPGKVHAWLKAPNLVQSVIVDGTVTPGAEGMSADVSVDGSGVTAEAIARYYENSRVQPILRDGTIHFTTHLAAEKTAAGVDATVAVKDFAFKDAGSDLVTADLFSAGGVSLNGNDLSVEKFAVHSPQIWATREADGSMVAAGIKILPPAAGSKVPDRLAEVYLSPSERAATRPSQNTAALLVATLKSTDLENASVHWSDSTVQPAASAQVMVSADLENVVIGKDAPPAKITATVHEDSALDRLTIAGTVTPSLDYPTATLAIDANGVRAGTLSPYLGHNVQMNLRDGRFHADIDAGATPNSAGGVGAHLLVNHLAFRDGADGPLLGGLDSFGITAPRIDLPGKTIAIDDISLEGLELPAVRRKDGTVGLLGVNLSGSPFASSDAAAPVAAVNVKGVGIANLAAVANEKYPLVTVEKLNLGVRSIAISDEYKPDAAPLTLADLRLTNTKRIELLGDNPQTGPPVDLNLTGAVNPLVGAMNIQLHASPFAEPAVAGMNVNLSGIRGAGVTDLFPSIKHDIDGSTLTDGQLTAQINLQLKQPRSDPLGLDLTKDFSIELSVKGVEIKDGANGNAIAGMGEIASDEIQFQPKNSTITVRDIEVTNPSAHVFRDAKGIHLLGLVVTPTAWRDYMAPATSEAPKPAVGEIAVNKLLVSGLNFNFEDRVCDPPLEVPLTGLDVEVRGLTSRMIDEDKSCRFSVLVNSGKVSLPRRNAPGDEQRDLFSQAEASGIVSLYPQPKGWVKTSINALDLAALTGEAKTQNINLGGGTFDATADVRLNGDGSMDLRSRVSLTDLELTEPANGPITGFLHVSSPLNVVIAALQDQDGSITLPIDVPIKSGHISSGDIGLAATGAVASVVATAVASTPLKASDAVMSLFGSEKVPKNERPVTLNFDPADPSLSLQDVLALRTLLQQAQDDPTLEMAIHHVFGGGDAVRAAVLANPSRQDSENLAYSLRLKKIALLSAREVAAQKVAAQIASGFGAGSNPAIEQLRNIDLALATTENAMDEMYDLLRPGADRQADRRTRAACLDIAQDRLLAVRDALLASGIPNIEQQIKVTHATFNPTTGNGGGQVVIVLTHKKNQ